MPTHCSCVVVFAVWAVFVFLLPWPQNRLWNRIWTKSLKAIALLCWFSLSSQLRFTIDWKLPSTFLLHAGQIDALHRRLLKMSFLLLLSILATFHLDCQYPQDPSQLVSTKTIRWSKWPYFSGTSKFVRWLHLKTEISHHVFVVRCWIVFVSHRGFTNLMTPTKPQLLSGKWPAAPRMWRVWFHLFPRLIEVAKILQSLACW